MPGFPWLARLSDGLRNMNHIESQRRPLQAALELAGELMRAHGLGGWSVRLDHARRRAGQCDYRRRIISLSRHYVRNAEPAHIRDTILHEIAHALVGPRHGHDAVWRRKAREIGCTAARCHTLTFAEAPWIARCPKGCVETPRHRRRYGLVCVRCRSPIEYVRASVNEIAGESAGGPAGETENGHGSDSARDRATGPASDLATGSSRDTAKDPARDFPPNPAHDND